MEKKRIKVVKLAKGYVSFRVPGKTAARKFRGENAQQMIPTEELEDCVYDQNIRTLFEQGYLDIEDNEFKKEHGLAYEEMAEANENQPIILNKAEANKILFGNFDAKGFEDTLRRLAPASKGLLLEIAKEADQHLNFERYDIIKKVYKIDLENVKRQMREEENN